MPYATAAQLPALTSTADHQSIRLPEDSSRGPRSIAPAPNPNANAGPIAVQYAASTTDPLGAPSTTMGLPDASATSDIAAANVASATYEIHSTRTRPPFSPETTNRHCSRRAHVANVQTSADTRGRAVHGPVGMSIAYESKIDDAAPNSRARPGSRDEPCLAAHDTNATPSAA
ncbi:hypothetical protein DK926_07240 [Rhodococcus sp. Eu-32]|nr:hypothetical protein DK926_07240 [Rhodococcus sp. Eu-32]